MAFTQGVQMIQNYYQKNNLAEAKIVDLESRFAIAVGDQKESHLITVIIDRIDKIETEGDFEIIDYKTSRKLPSQEAADNNWQLLIYLLAFLKRYPQYEKNPQKIKLSLYFVKHGVKLSTFKNSTDLENAKAELLQEIKKIEKSDFSPTLSPLCEWCGYQKICPMWKHKFQTEEPTEEILDEKKLVEEYLSLKEEIIQIKKALMETQSKILTLMEKEGVERLFGEKKIIAKVSKKTYQYDEEKLKKILGEVGAWESVLKINEARLKNVLETLPPKIKKMAEETKSISKESFSLSVKKGEN